MTEASDEDRFHAEAIRACAAGDRAALRRLYEHEASRMLGIAIRILRRRDLAEEAVQDAFLQVWRKADGFDAARGNGRAWLYAIVRNRALNILRDGRREDLLPDPVGGEIATTRRTRKRSSPICPTQAGCGGASRASNPSAAPGLSSPIPTASATARSPRALPFRSEPPSPGSAGPS
ncbi:ECF RNA polymerase sigma factor SigK [Methylobrevis pamukkalensis]|uniref:ECF RNA polymerase sigma factor SigK n=1 Tax=Methylobrevis pamukkalensis TaxID=1439726 RepID=A0A1E3H637_9HYPH|nr:ECF RNA polymerase sigma factor SigK [Methylobrevis pamukkalensis]